MGQTDPFVVGAAGTEQSALTGLHMEPTGPLLVREFLEYHASLGGLISDNDSLQIQMTEYHNTGCIHS